MRYELAAWQLRCESLGRYLTEDEANELYDKGALSNFEFHYAVR